MRILIFTEGTILTNKNWIGLDRKEIIRRIRNKTLVEITDFTSSVPIGNCAEKISTWADQGAEIVYLTSRRKDDEIEAIRSALDAFGFPRGRLLSRKGSENYGEVATRERPDILIEDDCESIGGESEMTFPQLSPHVRCRVKSIVVKEFSGIDQLPDNIFELLEF